MDINSAVAAELRAERGALSVTVDRLAETSGVPKRTLIRYLKAERSIDIASLWSIATSLGVDPGEIMRRAELRMSRDQAPGATASATGMPE